MLERSRGLTATQLAAIASLERAVEAEDGASLKLEWGTLNGRRDDRITDFLWWEGDQLAGFVGLYPFSVPTEVTGMVAPWSRRRGIATALLDAASEVCGQEGADRIVLVVPRPSTAGRAMALRRGARWIESEHSLLLLDSPTPGEGNPLVGLRDAGDLDVATVTGILERAFERPATNVAERLSEPDTRTLVIEYDGSPVGTLRLTSEGDRAGVYGFAVDPSWQGRGIGRDVLRRVCLLLMAEGATGVGLDVAVDNDRALGLYTSVGFAPVGTQDYYLLGLAGVG